MRVPFRPPMLVMAAALLGLIAVLATFQYQWLGRISNAEREQLTSTLNARAAGFAEDFDRELTIAYRLFQSEPIGSTEGVAVLLANAHARWQTMSRHPRLIKEIYVASREQGSTNLQRFDPATRAVASAEWPSALSEIRARLGAIVAERGPDGSRVIRTIPASLWEDVPALVVPMHTPLAFLDAAQRHNDLPPDPLVSFSVLVLDRDYITKELFPSLAQQHFRGIGNGFDYQMAVVSTSGKGIIYRSSPVFEPKADASADASANLFQVRPQDFAQLIADVRRFTTTSPQARGGRAAAVPGSRAVATFLLPVPGVEYEVTGATRDATKGNSPAAGGQVIVRGSSPNTMYFQRSASAGNRAIVTSLSDVVARSGPAKWRLLVKHPSGSLEAFVNSARRRNLLISSSILGVLAASVVMIVVSTRRSQELARQQMEFVAAVSHELRTPLAVIRSAADNLADGVVHDEPQIRKYGALMRSEGRRLSEMVEQILEFSGIHSGQRTLTVVPVQVSGLIDSVIRTYDTLISAATLNVEVSVPSDLPPVAGDEAGLRRVFQNLIGNAIKYGADGGWIGITARQSGSEVRISVIDRGIGIAAADQAHIFEPFYRAADVVAAQTQGAGLGLSLVHRIVEAHRGRVTVKSAKGAGSEFTVHLPIPGGQTAKRAAETDPGAQPHGSPAGR
jgi:signal transduction histidine kinase